MIVSSFVKLSIAGERVCFTAVLPKIASLSCLLPRAAHAWLLAIPPNGELAGRCEANQLAIYSPGMTPKSGQSTRQGLNTERPSRNLGARLSKVRVIDPRLFQLSPWTSKVKYGGTTCLGNYDPPAKKGQFVVRMTKPCLVFADSNLCISQ